MKKNKKKILFIILIFLFVLSACSLVKAASSSSYSNQEKIPGGSPTECITDYIKQIIDFGFAVIGILAMFMLCVGAYQYLMAAGNIVKVESAKQTIASALLGLVLGLTSYVILNTINPNLVKTSLSCTSSSSSSGSGSGTGTTTPNSGAGKCVEGTGNCAQGNMSCFGSEAKNASIVCNCESGGNVQEGGDKCGGTPVSYGLMQVNTSCHDIGLGCTSAFTRTDTGAKCCIGSKGCNNSNCQISNSNLYEQCKSAMQNSSTNLQAACSIYQSGGGWSQWTCGRTCL